MNGAAPRGKAVDMFLPSGRASGLVELQRPFFACQVLLAHKRALQELMQRRELKRSGVMVLAADGQVLARALTEGMAPAFRGYIAEAKEVYAAAYVQVTGDAYVRTTRKVLRALARDLSTAACREDLHPQLTRSQDAAATQLIEEVRLMLDVGGFLWPAVDDVVCDNCDEPYSPSHDAATGGPLATATTCHDCMSIRAQTEGPAREGGASN